MRECWFLAPGVGIIAARLASRDGGDFVLLGRDSPHVYHVPACLLLWLPWSTNVTTGGVA